MANPIYENTLQHWLNFKSPNYGRIEIMEPFNFDSFSFKIKQRTNGFGRDKEIGAEEIDLEFISNAYGNATQLPQTLIDGTIVYNLSHRFDLIMEAVREKGSESIIEYIVSNNNVDFVMGIFDIPESITDGYSYFNCSVVQNTNRALIERKKDIKADVFSTTDTFGNPQVPLQKTRILLKSKPVIQLSEWESRGEGVFTDSNVVGQEATAFNFASYITKAQIVDTFTVFEQLQRANNFNAPSFADNFKLITAQNNLSGITVTINQRMMYQVTQGAIEGQGVVFLYLIYGDTYDATVTNPKRITLYNDGWAVGVEKTVNVNEEFIYNVPDLISGESIWLLWGAFGNADCDINGTVYESSIKMRLTSIDVDNVTDAVPYYGFLQKGIKSISGLEFECDDIENGEFSNQFIFNGNMIRQRNDSALNFVFKDEMNDLQEVMMDYQIYDNKIACYQYPDFYKNVDMGAFLQLPDVKFERTFNDRFKKIRLEYGYKTYEQDRNEENTIDAFHTEAQFLFPNLQVDDELKVDINHVRDPFTFQSSINEILNSTTALSTDEKIFIADCVELPEGSTNSLTRELLMQASEPYILKIKSNGFKWTLLGFKNGDNVTITYGPNQGEYAVLQHNDDILELTRDDLTLPPFSGTAVITLIYPLTDVVWVNRTNEEFDIIEGIDSPDRTSNLKYTIKRNLNRNAWSSYLATICKDVSDGVIKCTDFKVNGDLTTQFQGGDILTEKQDIQVSTLAEKILDKYLYKTSVAIGFDQAKQLIEDIVNVRGYIRIYDTNNRIIKIHPTVLDMVWADGVMEITGESRNESDTIIIVSVENGVSIFQNGYTDIIDTNLDWFKIDNGYVQIFDNNQKPLINPTIFKNIMINGILFTDDVIFYETLDNL